MSRCLDCTECRIRRERYKEEVWCRKGIFTMMPINNAFLSVQRKCVYFEEEGVDDNITGNKGSNK